LNGGEVDVSLSPTPLRFARNCGGLRLHLLPVGWLMDKPTILLIESAESRRPELKSRLCGRGFTVLTAPGGTQGLESVKTGAPDLVIINSPQDTSWDGLEVAKHIRRKERNIPLILITSHSTQAKIVSALRAGIDDYFTPPFSNERFLTRVEKVLARDSGLARGARRPSAHPGPTGSMIGESPSIRDIKERLIRIAASDSTVLITGETGTGKEVAADLIHRASPRHKYPFVCVDCAAFPDTLFESELFGYERGAFTGAVISRPGKFELAGNGTVLLDEIGDMKPYAQAKILRAIETREIYRLGGTRRIPLGARFIAATNQDLEALAEKGDFRKDLYYRLNVTRIHMPALRERKEDIPGLIQHCIQNLNRRFGREVKGLTPRALSMLFQYDWPGNVRELKNLLEAAFVNLPARRMDLIDLPPSIDNFLAKSQNLPQSEKDRLWAALLATNWNKSKAAQKLHWSRMTLYRKMAKYHISSRTSRPTRKA
jgi:DNA-binding NtrC family response regulator